MGSFFNLRPGTMAPIFFQNGTSLSLNPLRYPPTSFLWLNFKWCSLFLFPLKPNLFFRNGEKSEIPVHNSKTSVSKNENHQKQQWTWGNSQITDLSLIRFSVLLFLIASLSVCDLKWSQFTFSCKLVCSSKLSGYGEICKISSFQKLVVASYKAANIYYSSSSNTPFLYQPKNT